MIENGYEKIHPKAQILWVLNGMIGSIVIMSMAIILQRYTTLWVIPGGLILSIYITLIHPFLEYIQWSYKITESKIDYTHGIYFRKRTIIPVSRIQHLDIKQGPLQKYFGLSNIAIYTAGQSHEIPALLSSKAQKMVESINDLILKETNHE
ncbi:MAG: PH domain-containing protein [Clostridia bacterium]|nr:PH domain-containing protein [Clostridia bacterium]